jgi:hypothetical protein
MYGYIRNLKILFTRTHKCTYCMYIFVKHFNLRIIYFKFTHDNSYSSKEYTITEILISIYLFNVKEQFLFQRNYSSTHTIFKTYL